MNRITLEIDSIDAATIGSMVKIVCEHGDPLQQMGAQRFSQKLARAIIEQVPGLKDGIDEALDGLRDEGAPDDLIDSIRAAVLDGDTKPLADAITADEVEGADLDSALDKILRDADAPEAA